MIRLAHMKPNTFFKTRMFNLSLISEPHREAGIYLDLNNDSERSVLVRQDALKFARDLLKAARLIHQHAKTMREGED